MFICHRCPSVCLSVCLSAPKTPFLQIQTVLLVLDTFKLKKLFCLCFFLLDTLYKCLKLCILSWHHGHAHRQHLDTWLPVQCETAVSVLLGFTIQCAFVRRQIVPTLIHGSTCKAMWCVGYVLYRALIL